MSVPLQTSLLAQQPGHIPQLAERLRRKWPHRFSDNHSQTPEALLQRACCVNTLPTGLLVTEGDACLGYIQVDNGFDVEADPEERVWLTYWLVLRQHRWDEISRALLQAAEQAAENMGVETLHVATRRARGLLTKLGWREVDQLSLAGQPLVFMEKHLLMRR